MNVVELMMREQDSVNALFALYDRVGLIPTTSKEEVAARLAHAVEEHVAHECSSVFTPLCAKMANELRGGLLVGPEVHCVLAHLIDEVVCAIGDETTLDEAIGALGKAVQSRFAEEKDEIFTAMRRLFSEQELMRLGLALEQQVALRKS